MYKVVSFLLKSTLIDDRLAVANKINDIQTDVCAQLENLSYTSRHLRYTSSEDKTLVCDLDTTHKDLKSYFIQVESEYIDPELILKKLPKKEKTDTKEKTYGDQFLYKIEFQRTIHNANRLVTLLKENSLSGLDIAKTLWFYLRVKRHILAEMMESRNAQEFSKTRYVAMHTGFLNQSKELARKAISLAPEHDSRHLVKVETANKQTYVPTSLEYLNDGDRYSEPLLSIIHHTPGVQRGIQNLKIIPSIFENDLTEPEIIQKSLYFYWLQIHDAPLERGTSSVSELFVKTIFTQSNISYKDQDSNFPLDYHALLYTPEEFISKVAVQLSLELDDSTIQHDFNDTPPNTIAIPSTILPMPVPTDMSKENVVSEKLNTIQSWQMYNLVSLTCTPSRIKFSSIAHKMDTICTLSMTGSTKERNESLITIIQDVEAIPIDPSIIIKQLENSDFEDNKTLNSNSFLYKVANARCIHSASQLIKALKNKGYDTDTVVDMLWFYVKVQRHSIATLIYPGDSEKISKRNNKPTQTVIVQTHPHYKKAKQLLENKTNDHSNIKISHATSYANPKTKALVISQKPRLLEKKQDIFEPLKRVLKNSLSSIEIVENALRFYWLQIHNAPLVKGTPAVTELCVNVVLEHFEIEHNEAPSDFKMYYDALLLPESQFLSKAMSDLCPTLATPKGCCTIS
jgi:hypothetical protein